MEIVDANVILRYLLKDNDKFYDTAAKIIDNNLIFIPFEVIAEVVYVLEKIYKVPRIEIQETLNILFDYPNVSTVEKETLNEALHIYQEKNIDFVDSILIAHNYVNKHIIHSFDKKVNKLLNIE